MQNNWDNKIKYIEDELLRLKTSNEYVSTRNAHYSTTTNVSTGLYKITYNNVQSDIVSMGFLGNIGKNEATPPHFRTPSGNTQILEVSTTSMGTTYSYPLTIISNYSVASIVRI